jgi:ubiquitin C-terminal hydrolase
MNEPNNQLPKIAKCGLRNIGNTCYMNSVLQTIIHNKLLIMFFIKIKKKNNDDLLLTEIDENIEFSSDGVAQYSHFLSEAAKQRLGDKIRHSKKLDKDDEVEIDIMDYKKFLKFSFSNTFSELLNQIIYKGNTHYTPSDIKTVISSKFTNFAGCRQQDAQEFLTLVLDEICEETGLESDPQITNPPESVANYIKHTKEIKKKYSNTEDVNEKELILNEFKKFKIENPMMVKQYEYIQYMINTYRQKHNVIIGKMRTFLVNEKTCQGCKVKSYDFDSTNILNVPLCGNSLIDCFDGFIKDNTMEKYKCKHCKEICSVSLNSKIASPSPVLYISLERFIKTHPMMIQKNMASVDIPEYIDIEKYCDFIINESNCKYKLRGIINHYGQYQGGHYTSYCRDLIDDNSWYEFDDATVNLISDFKVNKSSAYILLYESI